MGQIFILEGPDGGGKTTLAGRLAERVKQPAYHHVGPPGPWEDVLHHYAKLLWTATRSNRTHIFDRLHLGESVYGPIFRNKDELGTEGQTILQRMLSGYGAITILCLPSWKNALVNWQRRRAVEMAKDQETYSRIYQKYVSMKGLADFIYDYELAGPNEISDYVSIVQKVSPVGVIGSRSPRFLIVGDRANHEDLDAPFVSLTGSSHYLFEALHEAGFKESELAFINSTCIDGGQVDVNKVWRELRKPTVVALGNKASYSFSYPHHKLPHPAYWKRFHSIDRDWYVRRFREIRDLAC